MPLFNYQCKACCSVFEILVGTRERKKETDCPYCGGASRRQEVALFHVAGNRRRTSSSSLTASGGDFVSDPDCFVKAMDTFGEKIGDRLSKRQMENAVEKLKLAKR